MSIETGGESYPVLSVPEALLKAGDTLLPKLTSETLDELREAGWSRVGLMVAFMDTDKNIMMLEHNIRKKNGHRAFGPLGETSQHSGPIIEQPLETLYRGIQEELGIQHPERLDLFMHERNGWVVNQWPRGNGHPNEFSCAISFPVFLADSVKEHLVSIPHGTEEVGDLHFLSPEQINNMPDESLRPGVKNWLGQLVVAGLLEPNYSHDLHKVDFSGIFAAGLSDIELR